MSGLDVSTDPPWSAHVLNGPRWTEPSVGCCRLRVIIINIIIAAAIAAAATAADVNSNSDTWCIMQWASVQPPLMDSRVVYVTTGVTHPSIGLSAYTECVTSLKFHISIHADGSGGVGFLPPFVCVSVCFFRTMSQKPIQLVSPNLM